MDYLFERKMKLQGRLCKSVDTRGPTYDTTRHDRSFRVGETGVANRSLQPSDFDQNPEEDEFSGVPIEDLVGEEFNSSNQRLREPIEDLVGNQFDTSIRLLKEPLVNKQTVKRKINLSNLGLILPKISLRPPKQPNQAALRKTYASGISSILSPPKDSLKDRLKCIQERLGKLQSTTLELKNRYRSIQSDEAAAKGNIQRLIQVSFEKRRIKYSMEMFEKQTADLIQKEKHLRVLLDRHSARSRTFDILGVSESRASHILRKSWNSPVSRHKNYYDKELDRRELSAIKQGMPLRDAFSDLGCDRRMNFGIQERLFLKDRIISAHKDKLQASDAKKKEAIAKQSQNLEQIREGILQRKMLRNKGIFATSGERSLYPQRLTDSNMQPFLELRQLQENTDRPKHKLERFLSRVRPRSPIAPVSDDQNSTFFTLGNLSLLD